MTGRPGQAFTNRTDPVIRCRSVDEDVFFLFDDEHAFSPFGCCSCFVHGRRMAAMPLVFLHLPVASLCRPRGRILAVRDGLSARFGVRMGSRASGGLAAALVDGVLVVVDVPHRAAGHRAAHVVVESRDAVARLAFLVHPSGQLAVGLVAHFPVDLAHASCSFSFGLALSGPARRGGPALAAPTSCSGRSRCPSCRCRWSGRRTP